MMIVPLSLLGRAMLPIDYVACCIPLLVGRVIGSVRVRAEASMKMWYIEHVIFTRRLYTVYVYTTVITRTYNSGQHFKGPPRLAVHSLFDPASKDPEPLSRCLTFSAPCQSSVKRRPLPGIPLASITMPRG